MFKRIRNMHPVTGIAIGVVATLVLSGTAIAVTDTNFTYSTTKTGWLTIHPTDLAPANDFSASHYDVDIGAGHLTSDNGCFNTGVNLPQNARVSSMETFYRSGGVGQRVYLVRENLSTNSTEYLVLHFFSDSGGLRTSVTNSVPNAVRTVWNNVYSYGFSVCLLTNDRFEGARITYTYTNAGD